MIRQILFSLGCGLLGLVSNASQAQICVADTTLKLPGIVPDTLKHANVNQLFKQTISVRAFKDTSAIVFGVKQKVTVDSLKIKSILGLPNGMNYECLHPRCIFVNDQVRCILLSGTATKSGVFPLKIVVVAFAKVAGSFAIQQVDTMRQFKVVVENGTAHVVESKPNAISIYPNPVVGDEAIQTQGFALQGTTKLMDLLGKEHPLHIIDTHHFNTLNLPAGVYLLQTPKGTLRFIKQ